jgi:hypothetical protein
MSIKSLGQNVYYDVVSFSGNAPWILESRETESIQFWSKKVEILRNSSQCLQEII